MTDESLRGKAKAIHKESNIDCRENPSGFSRNDDATNNDEVSELEKQIDKLVYALYELNESEIKLIESK